MNGSFAHAERVPAIAVDRLQRNLAALLEAIADAVDLAEPGSPQAARWQRAHGVLTAEQQQLSSEVIAFNEGDRLPLLQHAADLRLLSRNLDGYTPDVADGDPGAAIALQQQLVVFTSWQIAAVASGIEGAGL